MSIFNFFKRRTKKNAEKTNFLIRANELISLLEEKSKNLASSYSEEKSLITSILDETKDIPAQDNPTAIKFEHSILEKATIASSLCDKAIIGKDSGGFKDALVVLANAVSQRKNFTDEE